LGFAFFGILLWSDPYILIGNYKTESITVWSEGEIAKALIFFNFSSQGFLSANYPIEVSAEVLMLNETLLSFLKGKNYVDLDIAGTFSYPIKTGPLGRYQGSISLQLYESNKLRGKSKVIFPYQGNAYYFQIFAYDSFDEFSSPIYTMNVSDIGKAIPPVFIIEETYASRVQFENSNRRIGLGIIALAVSSFGVILNIRWKGKKN